MNLKQSHYFYSNSGKKRTYTGPDTFVIPNDHKVAHYTYQNYSKKADYRNRNWF